MFAQYDMCKDILTNYPGLTKSVKRKEIQRPTGTGKGRGDGDEFDLGQSYWHIAGAESKGIVKKISILGPESLEVLQNFAAKNNNTIVYPDVWTDFNAGKLGGAKTAKGFKMKWTQVAVLPERKDILYLGVDQKKAIGDVEGDIKKWEKLPTRDVEENNLDGTYVSKYTGQTSLEWSKGKEMGRRVCQGYGKMERANGDIYEGYFLSNKFHGKGTFSFVRGDPQGRTEYVGSFESGLMHGIGQLFWSNGDSCIGAWYFGKLQKGQGE